MKNIENLTDAQCDALKKAETEKSRRSYFWGAIVLLGVFCTTNGRFSFNNHLSEPSEKYASTNKPAATTDAQAKLLHGEIATWSNIAPPDRISEKGDIASFIERITSVKKNNGDSSHYPSLEITTRTETGIEFSYKLDLTNENSAWLSNKMKLGNVFKFTKIFPPDGDDGSTKVIISPPNAQSVSPLFQFASKQMLTFG
jgi:hypothetical protein